MPHPIPYQGSKRNLAPLIAPSIPAGMKCWYEPFAGSAAMTIWAASHGLARRYVIGDVLAPLAELWSSIIAAPDETAKRYRALWEGQARAGQEYFNTIRSRYNAHRDPVDLLYLVCRCVKNAVRFNRSGGFTQSHDKRRLGTHPDRMAAAIHATSHLLKGRTEVRSGDWRVTTADAGSTDFLYMDPPYLGLATGRDKRYIEQLELGRLTAGLADLRARDIRFALSYDGTTGGKVHGSPLPDHLGLTRLLLHAGRSSQATLSGRSEETIESLYLSPGLAAPTTGIIRRKADQPCQVFARAN